MAARAPGLAVSVRPWRRGGTALLVVGAVTVGVLAQDPRIGRENALPRHLARGEEFTLPVPELVAFGRVVFTANWTDQDGAGRPLTDGTGRPLTDASQRLAGARAMNRVSGPDANSCAGCHSSPRGIAGGRGDFATVVFQGRSGSISPLSTGRTRFAHEAPWTKPASPLFFRQSATHG